MMVLRWHSIGLAATILVIAGCEGDRDRLEDTTRTTAAPPAAEMPTTEAPATRVPPQVVERAEELSEEVQDDIGEADWDDAAEKTTELKALSDSLRQTGASTADMAAYDSAVTSLAQKVESKEQIPAALAANEASRAVVSMKSSYSPKVPVEVGYMEVDARAAAYHAAAADWSDAESAVRDLSSNYAKVQAQVAQQDSSLANKVQTEIEQLGAAVNGKDPAAVRDASKKVLDDIDDVEDKFD